MMGAMLRRFAIKGFKSLLDIEQELPRLAVLAGPNAAGKSNFLDAIQALARLGTERTLSDALAPPIRGFPAELFTLPPKGLPALLTKREAVFSLEADLEVGTGGGNGRSERLRYRVGIKIDPGKGTLTLDDEYLARLTAQWKPRASEGARIERAESGSRLFLRQGSGSGHPRHEPLGGNHAYLSDARLSGQRWRMFDIAREELRLWRTYYLDPGTAMREAVPPREVPDIGVRGQHIAPFLYGLKAKEPKKFAAVRRALRSVIPAVGSLNVDLDTKRGTLEVQIEQDGTVYSSRIVSEGTLRVLALCAIAVTADRGLIAFEEPENGVQPQRLGKIAALLANAASRGGAQIIVTTHSPYFMAAMLEQARRLRPTKGSGDGSDIALFSVTRDGRATEVKEFPDPGLWEDESIAELLRDPDDYDKVAAVARRGWLDL
jgi:predicted ATPase